MQKTLSKLELYQNNIAAIKIEKQKREFIGLGNSTIEKAISRTKYLKFCWFCGKPYESSKMNSFACGNRCSQNIIQQHKKGIKPHAKMDVLLKEKNVREVKERLGY